MPSSCRWPILACGAALALLATSARARADEIPREYRATISKGLDYLARTQFKDGHMEGV